jgi:hypothetical protein
MGGSSSREVLKETNDMSVLRPFQILF